MTSSAGLDLSLRSSGIALTDPRQVWVHGLAGVTNMSVADQMVAIDGLTAAVMSAISLAPGGRPQTAVVEALDNAQAYGGQTERTALWWQVVRSLRRAGIEVWLPTSAQVKIFTTGNGLAKKPDMIAAVRERWPDYDVGRDDNKADAVAMAQLGPYLEAREGSPPLPVLPPEQARVLSRIRRITDPPSRVTKPKPKKPGTRRAAQDTDLMARLKESLQ